MAEAYDGPVCYVGQDHAAADGRPLEGGWHYTVTDDETPGEKLVVEPKTGKYRLAKDDDVSHREQHHKRLATVAVDGWIGAPQTDEEFAAAHRHLDELENRLTRDGLLAHEQDHVLTTAEEINVLRGWLEKGRKA